MSERVLNMRPANEISIFLLLLSVSSDYNVFRLPSQDFLEILHQLIEWVLHESSDSSLSADLLVLCANMKHKIIEWDCNFSLILFDHDQSNNLQDIYNVHCILNMSLHILWMKYRLQLIIMSLNCALSTHHLHALRHDSVLTTFLNNDSFHCIYLCVWNKVLNSVTQLN